MEKGILILLFIIMIPCSIILLLSWIVTWIQKGNHFPAIILSGIWIFYIGGVAVLYLIAPFIKPMKITKADYYGIHKTDLKKFSRFQAEWQYNNYQITINKDGFLRLYKLIQEPELIDSVKFEFTSHYTNPRIRLITDSTNHHIISESPTLYREPFNNFYLVFNSKKYGNMFFRKE
jgi:hypothetical protein